jgi:hypothetical protein
VPSSSSYSSVNHQQARPTQLLFADPASVARTAGDAHPQLRGHDIELLSAQFADRVQRAAAAWAIAALDVDQHFIPRQMPGQGALGPGEPGTSLSVAQSA